MFLRGGLGIVDDDGLLKLKEAVDIACYKLGLTGENEEPV